MRDVGGFGIELRPAHLHRSIENLDVPSGSPRTGGSSVGSGASLMTSGTYSEGRLNAHEAVP